MGFQHSAFSIRLSISLYICNVGAADAFPATVVEQRDIIAIDAIQLAAGIVHCVPVTALLDEEIAVAEDIGALLGIAFELTAGAMEDIPMAGVALHRHVAEGHVEDLLAVYAAHQVAILISQVPRIATTNTVVAVVEQVDLVAIEDRRTVAIDIDRATGGTDITAVPEVLVVVDAGDGLAGGHLVAGVLEPQVVAVGHHILRLHREAGHQS